MELSLGSTIEEGLIKGVIAQLACSIKAHVPELATKHMTLRRRGLFTYIWMTFTDECKEIKRNFEENVFKLLRVVRDFAKTQLYIDDDEVNSILITKMDLTVDC